MPNKYRITSLYNLWRINMKMYFALGFQFEKSGKAKIENKNVMKMKTKQCLFYTQHYS